IQRVPPTVQRLQVELAADVIVGHHDYAAAVRQPGKVREEIPIQSGTHVPNGTAVGRTNKQIDVAHGAGPVQVQVGNFPTFGGEARVIFVAVPSAECTFLA